jgi:pimeloyl-ACP methyl ester carboxylesterase
MNKLIKLIFALLIGSLLSAYAQKASKPVSAAIKSEKIIEYHTTQVNGINMAYLQAGQGEPLLLLHGFPQHSHMWRKVIPALAEKFLVIAPDLRGMGGSSTNIPPYDKKTLAVDVYELINKLGLKNVNVVGYDHGGGVAYSLAATHPEVVKKLSLLEYSPPGFGYEHGLQPVRDWQAWQLSFFTVPDVAVQFISGQERELLAWYFFHWSYNPDAISQADFEVYVRQLQKPGALRAGFSYFAAVFDDTEHFKETSKVKLKMPVLALGGEAGAGAYMVPGWQRLAENVSGGIVPKTGHWLADEQPEELVKRFLDFF